MEKKYIIELKDNTAWLQWVNVVEDGTVYFDYKYPEDLTPYTEPDLDAIRKEAYDEGYQEGMQLSIDDAKLKEEYKHGLNDAWECVRKLFSLTYDEKGKIFRTTSVRDIMRKYSASEAIEKIRQYEQEQDRQARIKFNCDEIKDVINTTMKECNVSLDDIAEVLQKMKGSES